MFVSYLVMRPHYYTYTFSVHVSIHRLLLITLCTTVVTSSTLSREFSSVRLQLVKLAFCSFRSRPAQFVDPRVTFELCAHAVCMLDFGQAVE